MPGRVPPPRTPRAAGPAASDGPDDWPGRDLGLPETGPRSVARFGRRLLALALDWGVAYLISFLAFDNDGLATLGVFALLQVVFLLLLSGSPGHVVTGMRVVPLAGGYVGPWRPVVRTLLICVVVPALVLDRDQRGLHDRIAGTVLVRV